MDGANTIRLQAQTPIGATAVTADPVMPATFADLFAEEHPRLVAMVLAMTGDRGLAEDVAQEALARAYHRWDVVGAYDRPGAWVRRVAINLATSARRRRGRELRALARVASRPVEAAVDPTDSDVAVWELVRTLPRRQATALVLYYLGDQSVADVAEAMGCAEGTAKAHLHQGRASLARLLGDPDPDPDRDPATDDPRSPGPPVSTAGGPTSPTPIAPTDTTEGTP